MGIKRSLDNDTEVHEVAEVQHEEVVLLSIVVLEPVKGTFEHRSPGIPGSGTCQTIISNRENMVW